MLQHLHTKNFYKFDEVMSALQKSIRRCKVKDTLFWAGELENSGFGAAMYNRLFTIISEDIGIAEPYILMNIYPFYEEWSKIRKKNPQQAALYSMCAAKTLALGHKNRSVNNLLGYITFRTQPLDGWKKVLPSAEVLKFIEEKIPFNLLVGVDEEMLDVRSALVYLAAAIEQEDLENAIFFTNLINLDTNAGDNRLTLEKYLGYKIKGSTKKLGENSSLYTWYLLLRMTKAWKTEDLYQFIEQSYILYIKKLGTPRLTLAQAVMTMVLYKKLDTKSQAKAKVEELTTEEKQLYYNNDMDLQKRRQLIMPNYAIDKHTVRGKGSTKGLIDNIYALHKATAYKNIKSETWSKQEIAKSHGKFKCFLDRTDERRPELYSRLSHFFDVGTKVKNLRKDWQGEDPFHAKSREKYLLREAEGGYRAAKSTQIIKKVYPVLLKNQKLWKYGAK